MIPLAVHVGRAAPAQAVNWQTITSLVLAVVAIVGALGGYWKYVRNQRDTVSALANQRVELALKATQPIIDELQDQSTQLVILLKTARQERDSALAAQKTQAQKITRLAGEVRSLKSRVRQLERVNGS